MRALDAILAVVWAPRCAACDEPLDAPSRGVVCDTCWRRLPALAEPICHRCGFEADAVEAGEGLPCPDCRRTGGPPTARRAAGVHAGALRDIIHAFKYDGRRSLARPLAQRMRDAAGDWLSGADVAVPVPLHALRRWRRGFNQAADLAAHLSVPVVDALRRTRHTGPQVELSREARLRALHGAFALARRSGRRRAAATVRGRSVVLVDDVITTGATVEACAAVLRNAGARRVRALSAALAVAARSPPPAPPPRHPAPAPRRCAPSPARPPDADSSPGPA